MVTRTTVTIFMLLSRKLAGLLLILISGWSIYPVLAADVCPVRDGQPLHFADIFDGPPGQLATLIPDKAEKRSGYWLLDYVYNAGRFAVVRCKYEDKKTTDVKLSSRVHKCDYKIDATQTLHLHCK